MNDSSRGGPIKYDSMETKRGEFLKYGNSQKHRIQQRKKPSQFKTEDSSLNLAMTW